jgi:hypothetical protein
MSHFHVLQPLVYPSKAGLGYQQVAEQPFAVLLHGVQHSVSLRLLPNHQQSSSPEQRP